MAPTTTKQWNIQGKGSFDALKFDEKAQIPNLGDHDVLVHFHAASLNYRDLIIPLVDTSQSIIWSITIYSPYL